MYRVITSLGAVLFFSLGAAAAERLDLEADLAGATRSSSPEEESSPLAPESEPTDDASALLLFLFESLAAAVATCSITPFLTI